MNYRQLNTLTIQGKRYQGETLISFYTQKILENAPPQWEKKLYRFVFEWLTPKPFIKVKTSGSTGSPKYIKIEKEKMVQSAVMTGKFFDLKPKDKALLCLPVEYIAGKMMIVRSFVLGLNLIPVEPSMNPLENINEKFDFAAMTPMQVNNIIESVDGVEKLNRIAKLIIGGAEIHPKLLKKISQLKNDTWQTYGMTETITHIAVRKLNGKGASEYYHALPGVSFEKDERNCLIICCPDINENKIVTNDIVELKNDREFKFIGRYDNIINSGGIKLSPETIEAKLAPYLNRRYIIAGLPDVKLGQKVILIIEGQGAEKLNIKEIAALASLSKYETPKEAVYISKFPLTETGKVIRKEVLDNFETVWSFEG